MPTPPILLAAAALAVTAGLGGCKKSDPAPDPRLALRTVAIARVERTSAMDSRYTGVVGARVESGLGFRVQGKVTERLVDTGQTVSRGQKLMRMDPTDYNRAVAAQAGNVGAARAKSVQAAADERRNRGLAATGAISQSAYDAVKATSDGAKALLDAAMAQERLARNQEDYSLLLADDDGMVMQTLAEPGQVLAPGQVVVRLAHAGPREAVVDLPETVRPEIGSVAKATLYGGGAPVPARLRQLSNAADPRTRTFEARYVLSGAGADAPLGATVTVTLGGTGGLDAVSVPIGAIGDEGKGPGLWVLDLATSKVAYRPVRIRLLGAEMAEVEGGVTVGETIVATGGHYLHEGEQVRPAEIRAVMR